MVAPAGMNTFDVLRVATNGLLLVTVTKTPLGEACARVTGYATDKPGPTITLAGRKMPFVIDTVTAAVVSGRPRALAWIVAVPEFTPVTGTSAVVAPALIVTVAGTVATPGVSELTLMTVLVCADEDSVNVRFCGPAPFKVSVAGVKAIVPLVCTA